MGLKVIIFDMIEKKEKLEKTIYDALYSKASFYDGLEIESDLQISNVNNSEDSSSDYSCCEDWTSVSFDISVNATKKVGNGDVMIQPYKSNGIIADLSYDSTTKEFEVTFKTPIRLYEKY